MEEIKNLQGYCINIENLIALEKRAAEDLENNTHKIGQEEILTIIREFIRCKNDYLQLEHTRIIRWLTRKENKCKYSIRKQEK